MKKKLKKKPTAYTIDRPRLPRATEKHPLLIGVAKLMKDNDVSLRAVAIASLGVTQQTLFGWVVSAMQDRDFPVPPRRVPLLCKLTGLPPCHFNPLLWPNVSWKFK